MFTYEAFQILMFLIPGFIAAKILNAIVYRPGEKEQDKIITALLFTMLIYTVYSFTSGKPPISYTETNGIFSYNSMSLFILLSLSITLPLIFSWFIIKDWHMHLLRKFHITRNTSRDSTWLDVFYDEKDSFITIEFMDGKRITGYPMGYSNNPDRQFVFLTKAAWIDDNDEEIPLEARGILITPSKKIKNILFHHPEKSDEKK